MDWRGRIARARYGHAVVFGVAAALGLALAGSSQVPMAWGAAQTAFDGNTFLSGAGLDGTFNFSVFSLPDPAIAGLSGAFQPGVGSPSALPSTGFIYLYQPVNDGAPADNIALVSQKLGLPGNNSPISPSSWGSFNHTVFCTNSPGCLGSVVVPGTPLPAGANPGFITLGTATNPASVTLVGSSLQASYAALPDPSTSSILEFTSPIGPQFDPTGATIIGTGLASGTDPDPAPEPSSILLSALALGTAFSPLARGRWRWHHRTAQAS